MRIIPAILETFFIFGQVAAQDIPACPDRGVDPKTFCPVGMEWNKEAQLYLGMA